MKQYDFIAETDENGKQTVTVANAPKRKKIDIIPLILCFIFSLCMWIYMINLNDTGVTATLTIPIEIEGIDELRANSGMMLYGVDKQEVVVTVKGSNRDLKRFTQADYRAVIDVSDIAQSGRHSSTVTVIVPSGSTITLDNKEHLAVNFYTDVSITKRVPFDYMQGNWITNPNYTYTIEKSADFVDITGPKAIVDAIETAKFRLPDDKYETSTRYSGFQLTFYDRNGDNITYDNSVVTYSTTEIAVKVNVSTQMLVKLDIRLPEGVKGVEARPGVDSVYVQGDPYVVGSVSSYTIELSESDVEFEGTILLTLTGEGLPAGVSLVTPDQTLRVTIIKASEEAATEAAAIETEESGIEIIETEEEIEDETEMSSDEEITTDAMTEEGELLESDTVESDTVESDTVESDTVESDTIESDTAESDASSDTTAQESDDVGE